MNDRLTSDLRRLGDDAEGMVFPAVSMAGVRSAVRRRRRLQVAAAAVGATALVLLVPMGLNLMQTPNAAPLPGTRATATGPTPTGPTPSTATPITSAPITSAECDPPLRIGVKTETATYRGWPITLQRTTASPRCPSAKGAEALVTMATQALDGELLTWRTDIDSTTPTRGIFVAKATTKVNVPGLSVVEIRMDEDTGGASSVTKATVAIVNTRTGEFATQGDVVRELSEAVGSQAGLRAILDRYARKDVANGGTPATKLAGYHLWPTQEGLMVTVDQCATYPCAAGVVTFAIPWDDILPPGTDLTFVPNEWGY